MKDAMVDDANPPPIDSEQAANLLSGEGAHGYDQLRALCGILGLCDKTRPEFGSGILGRNHEQVVKSGYQPMLARQVGQTLVQAMKNLRPWSPRFEKRSTNRLTGQKSLQRTQQAVRPITEAVMRTRVPPS